MLEWCEWEEVRFGLLCTIFLGNLGSVFELDDEDGEENEDNKAEDEEDCGMVFKVSFELALVLEVLCLRWVVDELLTTVRTDEVVGEVNFLKLGKSSAENTDLALAFVAEYLDDVVDVVESLIDVDEQLDAEISFLSAWYG